MSKPELLPGDLLPHILSDRCPCKPYVLEGEDGNLIIHRAWDGREALERNTFTMDEPNVLNLEIRPTPAVPEIRIFAIAAGYQAQAGLDPHTAFFGTGNTPVAALIDLLVAHRSVADFEAVL